jgi:hypothetical protein
MAAEPGLIKFAWHWLLYQFKTRTKFTTRQSTNNNNQLSALSKFSHKNLMQLVSDTDMELDIK